MALVLRGKMKGQTVTPAQWCNSWVTIKEKPKVFAITALEFTGKEMRAILGTRELGMMTERFERVGNRFKRRRIGPNV